MTAPHTIGLFRGPEILPWLEDVAALRMAVFRDWPYLYEGDDAYEREYLSTYAASRDSLFVLAMAQGQVVGAATGLPLLHDAESFHAPFAAQGMDPAQVFYFGESLLLPEWRGRGIGHAFFDHREAHAHGLGYRWTAFASVDRLPEDPRCPPSYRANDTFWTKRGYARQDGLAMQLDWREQGLGEVSHWLTFWLRDWEAA
ncbi:GNAT family N-acetyltransferase [Pseudoxanthomonas composti]|uniref:N-acetyltransferase n=1 Tax=Pseudoxanthomonas composti TaxID=2137479 RepID=A0A4Q1JVP7_9GAMM|nr:GNAT family N-acetyltransferase [Pseudoxanthomonas composti]RXR05238.1 N-acetyltransferase [Pseudoxanthomonas composti]